MTAGNEKSTHSLRIAVEGCGHGLLDEIYESAGAQCNSRGWDISSIDFLIICGDFQALRNEEDLNCMSVPRRHRKMGDFYKYYSGEKRAPVLTLVIGGNHEASSHLSELSNGGWLAPNIYYLGVVNVIRYGPIRIAGMSGIYHKSDYHKPHHERLPYGNNDVRSVYHVRECDISKLLRVRGPIDIGLSHDWPRRVEWFGNHKELFAARPTFFTSAKIDNLGSLPAEQVLNYLRPKYWFSGHMHVKYSAVVEHQNKITEDIFEQLQIPEDIQSQLPKSMFKSAFRKNTQKGGKYPKRPPPSITNIKTQFLGLDKPGERGGFLELVEIEIDDQHEDPKVLKYLQKTSEGKFKLQYDEEWLSIVRSSSDGQNDTETYLHSTQQGLDPEVTDDNNVDVAWIRENITEKGLLDIPENFERHAPVYDPENPSQTNEQPLWYPNSQTRQYWDMLQVEEEVPEAPTADASDDFIVFE